MLKIKMANPLEDVVEAMSNPQNQFEKQQQGDTWGLKVNDSYLIRYSIQIHPLLKYK